MRVTQQPSDDLCDSFAPTIISRNLEKNYLAERLFNCWIDSLHENCNVTINFTLVLFLSFEQQNWGLNKLAHSSVKPSALQAQPRRKRPQL